jgi:hypothetical protein
MNTANETIEKQDPVHEWRVAQLVSLGLLRSVAEAAAGDVDWHQMAALVRRGLPSVARTPHPALMRAGD